MKENLNNLVVWGIPLGLLVGALALAFFVHYLLFRYLESLSNREQNALYKSFVKHCNKPSQLIFLLIGIIIVLPMLTLSPELLNFCTQIFGIILILAVAWLLVHITFVAEDFIMSQYRIDESDNLLARRVHTQIQFFKKVIIIGIIVLALASVLMTFDRVRQLGTSILASAGIIGIIIGFSAQRSIATLMAGLQIAITQPIRIDDVVIVENEWGRVEEITLTYVVIRIWDQRRLILPITYFIEKSFQNWTRLSAELLGTVFLYVDYTVPVEAVREELTRILEGSSLWDRRVNVLQVTNSTDRTMELRALMSASDASNAWSLRCEVREKLIEFVQKHYPDNLPKLRAEVKEITPKITHGC
ncbi:MAG: mechanosensitive ion channel [Thermodesulfobacteriota bacterium]|nr:mechanosensitive ion channel [Thermodesulfobacteriota bacterium]